MKSVLIALTVLLLLSGCGPELTKLNYSMTAPDTPLITDKDREPTAKEIEGPLCPYTTAALQDCEMTRDQSRLLRSQK